MLALVLGMLGGLAVAYVALHAYARWTIRRIDEPAGQTAPDREVRRDDLP